MMGWSWLDVQEQWERGRRAEVRPEYREHSLDIWSATAQRLRVLMLEHPGDEDIPLLLGIAASFAAQAQQPLEMERLRRQVQELEALAADAGDTTHQTLAADLLARLQAQPQT